MSRDRATHPSVRQIPACRRHLLAHELAYDPKRDCYICPAGNELRQRQKIYRVPRPLVDRNDMMRYRASKLDCQNCSLKPQCCPNAPPQRSRALSHEGARRLRPRRRFICVSSDTAIRVPRVTEFVKEDRAQVNIKGHSELQHTDGIELRAPIDY